MSHFTSKKGVIIRGAFILTLTGFLSRFIGFFYRVFLSQTFGEEGVGLYQLIFPVYALCYSLTVAGIETALSRAVASKVSLGKEQEAKQLLYVALGVSVFFSAVITCILQANASWATKHILLDVRCAPLLVAMSYSFPFSAIHSCICGYCFGLKQTGIPAIAQLVEQTARVAAVYIIYLVALKKSLTIDITFAVLGLVFGEITSSFFCVKAFSRNRKKEADTKPELPNIQAEVQRINSDVCAVDCQPDSSESAAEYRSNLHPRKTSDVRFKYRRSTQHLWCADWDGSSMYFISFSHYKFHLYHDASYCCRNTDSEQYKPFICHDPQSYRMLFFAWRLLLCWLPGSRAMDGNISLSQ